LAAFRIARIVVNSFAGCILLLVAGVLWAYNPLLSAVLVLVSLDQFEDVYYYVYGRRLIPGWLMPLDVLFEGVCLAVGAAMAFLGVIYMRYFQTWFFQALLAISILVVWSAVEDIAQWGVTAGVMTAALREEEARFVRRK